MQLNAENLTRVFAPPEPLRASRSELTQPQSHEFHTERRSRSRSCSVHSSTTSFPDVSTMTERLAPRERSAVERHVERLAAAQMLDKVNASQRFAERLREEQPAASSEQEEWIRQGASAEERAQRARTVAQALRAEVTKAQRAKLCIFRRVEADPEDLMSEAGMVDGPLEAEKLSLEADSVTAGGSSGAQSTAEVLSGPAAFGDPLESEDVQEEVLADHPCESISRQ